MNRHSNACPILDTSQQKLRVNHPTSNRFNVEIVVKTVIWIWNEEEIQISGGMESIRGVRIGRVIELVGSRAEENEERLMKCRRLRAGGYAGG